MDFKSISLNMFKADKRKYILQFLTSCFMEMLLFIYLKLYTNKDFNDYNKVDSMISSNVKAPTIILFIFSFFTIVYFHNQFIKSRKKDLSIFMILGMRPKDIISIIFFENIAMCLCSCAAGLLAGTIFSKIFYFIIIKITDINIDLSINIKSYLYSAIFFIAVNLIIIIKSCLTVPNTEIIKLLKSKSRASGNFFGKSIFAAFGICIIILQTIVLIFFKYLEPSLYVANLINLAGIYLIISNLHIIFKFVNRFLIRNKSHTIPLWLNSLAYSIGSIKNLILAGSLLITVLVYLSSFCSVCCDVIKKNVFIEDPYNISYIEIYGKNEIPEDKLNNIIENGSTELKSKSEFEVIDKRGAVLVSDKNINKAVNTNFNVEKGKYIFLLQINPHDGYRHNEGLIKSYDINDKSYTMQECIKKIIFNNNILFTNNSYLIFNDEDYNDIKSQITKPECIGKIKLFNFKDWTKTKGINDSLTEELLKYNKENSKQFFDDAKYDIFTFKPCSKTNDYMAAEGSRNILNFLFFFIYFLFFISSNLIIHFKLMTEIKDEKIKYDKLYKIGFSEKQLSTTISKEMAVFFIAPCICGIYSGIYWIYLKLSCIGIDNLGVIKNSFICGGSYFVLEIIFYIIYRKYYINKILNK